MTLVPDTVRQLPFGADPQALYGYFDKLEDGTEISDYVICELRLTGPAQGGPVFSSGTICPIPALFRPC